MAADLVSCFECAHAFFLRKFLILSHNLNLKTPIEDSRLRHKPDFIHHFFTKGEFACLIILILFGWFEFVLSWFYGFLT